MDNRPLPRLRHAAAMGLLAPGRSDGHLRASRICPPL